MLDSYRAPRDFMPFWHFGARMGIGTVRRFYARMRRRGLSRVLDAGTGGGANVLLGAWTGLRAAGCDLSRSALATLRETSARALPRVEAALVQADSTALPFRGGAFDIVVASHIVEHLAEPRALFTECARVLRRGGVLRVSCPSQCHGMRIGLWFGLKLDPEDHTVRGYAAADIAAMLPAGMRVSRVSYQGRFIESNVSDAQFMLARALGMSGNPAVAGRRTVPLWLFAFREMLMIPLLALAKCEDALLFFAKGSMISVEIEKSGE